ncbi:MAG: hypothetical protein M3O46_14885 [Myxococcota bacterium]|nr:hypothetical protein [Myxococcota bacterium]
MVGDPFWKGLLVSAALNVLATAAALAVSLRAKLGGRAELALSTIMTWNFLVMCPVYALGLTGHLVAGTLACVSAVFFALVLAIARGRAPLRAFNRELGLAGLALLRLPFEAVVMCARRRTIVTMGAAFTFGMVVWTFGCSYLAPSWKQWDALWYHEPMVGFAIQNHGFAFVDFPLGHVQKINGYPRLCEMTQLWFVIFTDRRLIDMVGYVAAPALALGAYVLAQRYLHDTVVAIGFACALVLMPACVRLLGSTYVDAHNAAFVVAGVHFATRPSLRLRDAMLAAICLALAVGSKSMALVPVGILSLVVVARLLPDVRRRSFATLGTLALGTLVIGASAASIYWRNWRHFGNPFWPDLKYDNPKWGIHWPGLVEWGSDRFELGEGRIDMNVPFKEFVATLYQVPYSVRAPHTDINEYGIGLTWVAFPIAAIAVGVLCIALVRDVLARVLRIPAWRLPDESRSIAPVVLTLLAMLALSPALWSARYQIAAVGLVLAVVAWAVSRRPLYGLGEEVAVLLTVMSIVSFFWTTPRTWLKWSEALAFAKIPYPEREFTPASAIDAKLEIWNGSPVTRDVGIEREKQLGPGAILAFPDNYGVYMALFWNNTFSNRVVYVPSGPNYVDRLMEVDATWAYCATGDPVCSALSAPHSGWEVVGVLDVENRGSVYRRTGR